LLFNGRYSPCSFEVGLFFEVTFKGGFEHETTRKVPMRKTKFKKGITGEEIKEKLSTDREKYRGWTARQSL